MTELFDQSDLAKFTRKSLISLSQVLQKRYNPTPFVAEDEFFSLATNTICLIDLLTEEIVDRIPSAEINWDGLVRLAFELGNLDIAKMALKEELLLLREDGQPQEGILISLSEVITRKKYGDNWRKIIDEARNPTS